MTMVEPVLYDIQRAEIMRQNDSSCRCAAKLYYLTLSSWQAQASANFRRAVDSGLAPLHPRQLNMNRKPETSTKWQEQLWILCDVNDHDQARLLFYNYSD